ncbi:MAG: 4Fe-4S dicluster domain-containing protein, partial [Bacteroidales bacterium]|nr:4Fe-4S dicluster domain-containing protein [Bacteroidales bacterium]
RTLMILALFGISTHVLAAALEYIYLSRFRSKAMKQYRGYVFGRLLEKGIQAFSGENSALYLSALSNDVNIIERDFINPIQNTIGVGLTFIGALSLMLWYSPLLTLVSIGFSLLPIAAAVVFGNKAAEAEKQASDQKERYTGILKDILTGFAVIKSSKAEVNIARMHEESNEAIAAATKRRTAIGSLSTYTSGIAGGLLQFGVFFVAAALALSGNDITGGTAIAFVQLLNYILGPINAFPAFYAGMRSSFSLIDKLAEAFEKEVTASGLVSTCTRVYGAEVARVWDLRKAGLGVLSGMKGDAKPIGVIEDTAVAPERLPAYMQDFREMLDRLHTSCVFYGHISTGELHLRPILNIKTAEGRKLFRDIATETAHLVRRHKGSLSGEHGDGRLRGEFIPMMYGPEVYRLMQEVKRTWDPDGLFNMHKIVDTPPMDESLRFEVGQTYPIESMKTYYNWRAAFDECKVDGASGVRSQAHALMCSVEQCNGAGACLKSNLIGGTMCPAYKVSRDELFSTRARANILREVLTRGTGNFDSPEMASVLDSCLACKGCLSECPSNVDMTRIRSEVLQQKYDRHGMPLRSWLVARMASIEALGAVVRPLYNFFASWKPSAALIKRIIRFSADRHIPTLSRFSMRKLVRWNLSRPPAGKCICSPTSSRTIRRRNWA